MSEYDKELQSNTREFDEARKPLDRDPGGKGETKERAKDDSSEADEQKPRD